MKAFVAIVLGVLVSGLGWSEGLRAGAARASVTPIEENIPTPLGGYGAREGKPAEGIHDTLYAKVLVLESGGKKGAVIGLDACTVPVCALDEALQKAGVAGLTRDNVLLVASHSHGALEGMTLDRRNTFDNPYVGVFSEPILNFVTDRIAKALKEADAALQPVTAASGTTRLPGMNRNRRGDAFVDEDLTLLRLDRADGSPLAVLVNYTAHGTIVSENEMLASGEWAGQMQRTVEDLLGQGVTCVYTNGAEGDISPANRTGASAWEQMENYGRRVGIVAARLAESVTPTEVKAFDVRNRWVKLPPQQPAPEFEKIAGDEYHITQDQLKAILPQLFPAEAPVYALRVDDFLMATFPGEPICQLGLSVKAALRAEGIAHPCVSALTSDGIGYILTKDEYAQSGYEVTASFYGDGLGEVLLREVTGLATETASGK